MKPVEEMDFRKFNFGTSKWTDGFETEADLISHLQAIDIELFKNRCQGHVFIQGFQSTLQAKGELSPKQVTQLKRLWKEIYKYHNNLY